MNSFFVVGWTTWPCNVADALKNLFPFELDHNCENNRGEPQHAWLAGKQPLSFRYLSVVFYFQDGSGVRTGEHESSAENISRGNRGRRRL